MGNLKRIFCLMAVAAWAVTGTCLAHAAPDLLASYHFLGSANFPTDTNTAILKEIWGLPATGDFREQVLQKLSKAPGQLLANRIKPSADQSALVRPLLNDLLAAESRAELRRGTNGPGEGVFAIRLQDERAGVWQTNLTNLLAAWTGKGGKKIDSTKFVGWEFKQSASPNLIRIVRALDWLVVGVGQNELPLLESWVAEISQKKSLPKLGENERFKAGIDWPRLQEWLPISKAVLKPARTEIVVSGNGDSLRTIVRAVYPEKINWKCSPWQIPTNLVRDPIISFTAAQKLSSILKEPAKFQQLSVRPMESQFYLWSLSQSPFHSLGAVPVDNASNALRKLEAELPATFNQVLKDRKAGKIVSSTNRHAVLWQGVPLLAPEITATNGFLYGGLFHPARLKNPPPDELMARFIGRTNLIYYDWEITQERLGQWQLLSQILPPFEPKRLLPPGQNGDTNAPAAAGTNVLSRAKSRFLDQSWQSAAGKFLGNTITEVTLEAPNEVQLLRKSHLGFTGFELIMLTRWLNDPAFPLFGYQLPPPSTSKK